MLGIIPTPNEVAGKVVLVTGAASGIGRAIALLLHSRGAKVVAEDTSANVDSRFLRSLLTQLRKARWHS
jgi:NAD(P)-dependent dehydrogenase (short-subunit alcohol dehydrogenase family)